jgi:hypothetical protein
LQFLFDKSNKIDYNSATDEAGEKISAYLEFLEFLQSLKYLFDKKNLIKSTADV